VPPPIPFGQYELLERIAEGGMAELWRARSRGVAGFEKTLVVKRVLPSLLDRPGFTELLVREARIAARLSHPNIVQIFDLGIEEGGYFIAMELLRGRDLAAALALRPVGETPLSLPLRLWIAAEVARALEYAHRAKGEDGKPLHIVHRDISPQNVLLGFEGEVKVADFGIARADQPGLGRGEDPRILRGKFAYMSPEQARGEPLDRRSDLFSLGIVLYELVTRQRMFRGKSSAEALDLLRRQELPPIPDSLPLDGVRPVLERALAPAVADRYASAAELHADLVRLSRSLGAPVGPPELAAVMKRMFPSVERLSPNKLRGDVLLRAHEDAAAAGDPQRTRSAALTAFGTQHTRALPVPRRRVDVRRLVWLIIRPGADDEARFDAIVEATGGTVVALAADGLALAAYGMAGVERAAGHAARAALELRRHSRLDGPARLDSAPPTSIVAGDGTLHDGDVVEPGDDVLARALAVLGRTDAAEIRVAADLRPELARDFQLLEHAGDLLVDGFRARHDRDATGRRAPLLGRRDVLRTLTGLLTDTARGAGKLVHLLGEPGVGKSRVLAELRSAAASTDFAFVHGRADEAEVERSFAPLADLVADLAEIEPEDAPATRFAKIDRLSEMGLDARQRRLLGELVGLAYPWAREARPGRSRGVELALALRKAIRSLANARAVVLALEDLQWMDDATQQVLPLLVDGLPRTRVLVLLVRRPDSSTPLRRGGRTLELTPLDMEATGQLVAHALGARRADPGLAAWVHAETGGVPGWIELLTDPLRRWTRVDEGVARLVDGGAVADATTGLAPRSWPSALPDAIRTMLVARSERLRPRDRSMLRAVAAMGGSVDVKVASAVEGLVGRTERPILRRLLARRLLTAGEAQAVSPDRLGAWGGDEQDERLPSRVRIPSELMRRAFLSELASAELGRLHARIVRTLERAGEAQDLDALERLADHAARSPEPGAAVEYLQRAAAATEAAGDVRRGAGLLLRAARVGNEAGLDSADVAGLALAAGERALRADALDLVPEALAAARSEAPGLALRTALLEARWALRRLDPRRATEVIARVAGHEPDPPLRVEAAQVLASAWLDMGRTDAALAELGRALSHAEDAALGRLLALRAEALAMHEGRAPEAEQAAADALAVAARSLDGEVRAAALAALAVVREVRGELASAAARYAEAAELPDGERGRVPRWYARAAVLRRVLGDAAAVELAGRAAAWAERLQQPSWAVVAGVVQSIAPEQVVARASLAEDGRFEEAALVSELLAVHALDRDDRAAARTFLDEAAELCLRGGRAGHARRLRQRRESLDDA
jgi:serine/threonine protein kinase/tetratricopeptide (TPR) repeat protein